MFSLSPFLASSSALEVTYWLIVSTDLTDVTLVSDDTVFARIYVSELVNMFSDHLESCQTHRKVSRSSKHFPDHPKASKPSGKFLNHPESFQTIRKVSRRSESFQIIRKVSRSSGKFPNHPESFQIIQKVSRSSGKFPDHLEICAFWHVFNDGFHSNVQKLSGW